MRPGVHRSRARRGALANGRSGFCRCARSVAKPPVVHAATGRSYLSRRCGMKLATRLVRYDQCPGDPYRPMATPIYHTATFEQESATEFGAYDYSRSGNPTRTVLERQLAEMENANRAFAFASGMAASCRSSTVLVGLPLRE